MTLARCIELVRATALQDCGNVFDGDTVPSVADLADTAADCVKDLELTDAEAVATCENVYIAAYRAEAARLIAIWRERYAQTDD